LVFQIIVLPPRVGDPFLKKTPPQKGKRRKCGPQNSKKKSDRGCNKLFFEGEVSFIGSREKKKTAGKGKKSQVPFTEVPNWHTKKAGKH